MLMDDENMNFFTFSFVSTFLEYSTSTSVIFHGIVHTMTLRGVERIHERNQGGQSVDLYESRYHETDSLNE